MKKIIKIIKIITKSKMKKKIIKATVQIKLEMF